MMDGQNKLISPIEGCRNENEVGDDNIEILNHFQNEDRGYLGQQGQLCRLCANTIKSGVYIFSGVGEELRLADKINTCLPVTVKVTDCLPKQLCIPCKSKLNVCYDFAETCVKAEEKLKTIMQIRAVNLPVDETWKSFYNYADEFVNNASGDKTNSYKKIFCCPLCCEGNMIPQEDIYNAKRINSESKQFNANGGSTGVIVNNKELHLDTSTDAVVSVSTNTQELINGVKCLQSEESIQPNSNITSMCHFCNQFCPDLSTVLTHSNYHSNDDGFPCIVCGNYFSNGTEVQNHYKIHNSEMCKKIQSIKTENSKENNYLSNTPKLCKCSECGKIFGTMERLSFHTQFHNGARALICEQCAKEFTSENLLFRHMNLVHGGTEICKKCGATFMSKSKLDSHICSLIKQPFRCKICRKEFQDTSILRKHTTTHNFILAKPYQCNQCDASFTRISKLNEHVKNSHSISDNLQSCITCSTCRAVFPNIEFAVLHVNKHSSSELMDRVKRLEETEVTKLYCCEFCEALFSHMDHLIKHSSEHNGLNPYHCTICNMLFSEHYQMQFHKKYHLEQEKQWDLLSLFSVPILYVCVACSKSFNTWKGLQIHYNVMHSGFFKGNIQNVEQKDCKDSELSCHICDDCGESFKKRVDLRRHRLKMHRPQNQFPCEECGKVLLHYSGLVIHRRQHTGERPFMCDVCGKSFPQGPAMYTHRRTHTRDYPYRCEICERTFNNKGDLNNHRRSKHTKERPFKCNVCSKSFLTSGVYYQHKQLHAGIRKYKCMHCERAFSRWNALSIHIKSHTGEKPHACHVCGRGFAQKGDMKKHMRTQHGVLK